jgi:hypothetical protein
METEKKKSLQQKNPWLRIQCSNTIKRNRLQALRDGDKLSKEREYL